MKRKGTHTKTQKKTKQRKQAPDYQRGRETVGRPGMELKAFDVAQGDSNFTTAGVFNLLNAQTNGAELFNRVGRKVTMKSVHIRGVITNILTSVQDFGRILLVYDSQSNAAVFNIAALLQDSNAGAATAGTTGINLTNRARFKILRDYQMLLPSVTNTAGVLTNVGLQDQEKDYSVNLYVKMKGLQTEYNGVNGGTIADITSGSLYLITLSTNMSSAYKLTYSSRVRYFD